VNVQRGCTLNSAGSSASMNRKASPVVRNRRRFVLIAFENFTEQHHSSLAAGSSLKPELFGVCVLSSSGIGPSGPRNAVAPCFS
jgi:hypothetical protein